MKPIGIAAHLLATGILAFALDAGAQLKLPAGLAASSTALGAGTTVEGFAAAPAEAGEPAPRVTPEQLRLRNAAIIAGGVLLVGAYGAAKWWEDGFTGDFRAVNEGWFGQNTEYGGADKLGHAFSAYVGTRVVTRAFEAVGNEAEPARQLAAWSTLAVMMGIEVLDGYSKRYRFSWQDAAMNIVGVGIGYLSERNQALDDLLDFRLLYKKSSGASFDPAGDYSGQTYLLVAKASGVPALQQHGVLRYFELAAGYGTRGYESPPGVERKRNLYFGVSVNLSEVLAQTVFRGSKERGLAQRGTDLFLEFVQIPGTAALASHRL